MGLFDLIGDVLGNRVVIHITRNPGDSLKAQEQLMKAGIKFKKEIEGMASTHMQVNMGHVSPVIKLKVRDKEASMAKEIIKKGSM